MLLFTANSCKACPCDGTDHQQGCMLQGLPSALMQIKCIHLVANVAWPLDGLEPQLRVVGSALEY